jgi:Bacterial Ig-like domain
MSGSRDPELEDLFDRDPELERFAHLIKSARLKPPPVDPGFRPALRRRLMQEAYDRYERRHRPWLLARLFSGPRFAMATAAVGAVLIAVLVLQTQNLFAPGQVEVSTVGAQLAVTQPITVSFNQPMDHKSVEKSIHIEPATQVTYAWQGNNLVIEPASGQLAPNTQYHVTVNSSARTPAGKPIGQVAVLSITTAPAPSPPPTPSPSPSPPPPPQITAERSLPGTSGRAVGWSADGRTLIFITTSGDLDSIGADGTGLKTIASGVRLASLAPGGSALAYATAGSGSKLYLAGPEGSAPQVVDQRSVDAIGWQGGKPIVQVQGEIGAAGATTKLPSGAALCVFSPDGGKLLCEIAPSGGPASPQPGTAFLFDLATQKATNWTTVGQGFAWRPDASKVAYWSGGSVFIAAPDGSGAVEVGKAAHASGQGWSTDGQLLLFAGPDGASLVKADATGLQRLSQSSFQDPSWAPNGGQFVFARDGVLWIDDVAVAGNALDLGAAGRIVDQYETARIKNDSATATGLLTTNASPTPPSPLLGDVLLTRYFVISSQATARDVRFAVRLIFARGINEIRYQDESLLLVPAGSSFKIDTVTDAAQQQLGKGPTVNSVQVQGGKVVIVFDSDLNPATVDGSVQVTGADGKALTVTTAYGSRRVTVSAKLVPGAKYRLTVSNAVMDIAGQALQGDYTCDFVAPA